jgi:hypothetical protein
MANSLTSIDARGPRFSALITTFVLATILITESLWLLVFQAIAFGVGAFLGPNRSPYGLIYKYLVQGRLKGEVIKEDIKPPQFAQLVGFIFAITALVGLTLDIILLFQIAVAFALFAAFLNAFFNFCLGCQMYLIIKRITTKKGK